MTNKYKLLDVDKLEKVLKKYEDLLGWATVTTSIIRDVRAMLEASPPADVEPVALMAIKIAQIEDRVKVLEDLLSSAYNIANRNGKDTHWPRFAGQLHIHGINPITPKTFKILPSDDEYTHPPADKDAERYRWLKKQNAILDHDSFVVLTHDCTVEEHWQKYWVGSDLDEAIDKAMGEVNHE